MAALVVLLPLLFLAFSLRGGVILRVLGWLFIVAGVFAPFSHESNAGHALLYIFLGALMLVAGHWAYAFAYYHYKSPRAERIIEGSIVPRIRARAGLYQAEGPVASALRTSGAALSRTILRSRSGLDKVQPPIAPADGGGQAPGAERDFTAASPTKAAESHLRETLASLRERIGVSNRRYERLQESLAKEQALSAERHRQLDALEARDRAREDRLNAALTDAATLVRGLDRSISTIAALVAANRAESEEEIATAVRAMLGGRVRSVEILRAEELSADLRAFVHERGGVATRMREEADEAGEHRLEMTAALAGQRAIVATYADGIYDDGPLSGLVEQLCHAVVASLEGRDLAREKGRRLPISLLGDAHAHRRLAVLRDAQGFQLATIVVRIEEDAYRQFTGVFGEAAWNAELFALASELDGAARSVGGEVFEIGNELVCLVAPPQRAGLRERFDAIVAQTAIAAEVLTA